MVSVWLVVRSVAEEWQAAMECQLEKNLEDGAFVDWPSHPSRTLANGRERVSPYTLVNSTRPKWGVGR